jgi:hypothetical protein
MSKEGELTLRIVLEKPTPGVDYGLQEGKGTDFKTTQTKRGNGKNIVFEFKVRVKLADGIRPLFLGPFAQGSANGRFVYIDIGTFAGQKDSCWDRRLKISLSDITFENILQALSDPEKRIETIVPGADKDGAPNCGTVKPFNGLKLKQI